MDVTLLGIPLGLILLYYGADWLVEGAKKAALILGVSPFVVGLTIVAFGSSAPEAATALMSAKSGAIVLGTVVGSNIANIALIIGISAMIFPLTTRYKDIRLEIYALLGSAVLMIVLSATGVIGLLPGLLLFALIFLFVLMVYRNSSTSRQVMPEPLIPQDGSLSRQLLMSVLGLALLIIGATVFIDGAVALAEILQVSELVIGLIVVAVGTSLPELTISVVAAFKKETEIALSNIIGSNIFNALFVLGIGAVISPLIVPASLLQFDLPVMLLLTLILISFIRWKDGIPRYVGLLFFFIYVAYILLTVLPTLTLL